MIVRPPRPLNQTAMVRDDSDRHCGLASSMTTASAIPAAGPNHESRAVASPAPGWMRWTLIAAAVYNLLWGGWVVLFPNSFFHWIGADPPRYPEIWQCVGMIVGVYGIGYACAAMDPLRHWPIVLVGFLGKILGPIGFVDAVFVREALPPAFGYTILTNDLIWWVPFGLILYQAAKNRRNKAA